MKRLWILSVCVLMVGFTARAESPAAEAKPASPAEAKAEAKPAQSAPTTVANNDNAAFASLLRGLKDCVRNTSPVSSQVAGASAAASPVSSAASHSIY